MEIQTSIGGKAHSTIPFHPSLVTSRSFKTVLNEINDQKLFDPLAVSGVSNLSQKLLLSPKINPQDLLRLQLKMSQYNLKVELVSKIAETFTSTARRLQQG